MLSDYSLVRKDLGENLPVLPTERTAEILEEMLSEAKGSALPVSASA
jgi:hypothetical protein